MCKRVIYRALFALCRTLLKRRMMTNMPKIDEGLHPAVSCVRNFMSGSDDCLVLWGLRQSDTRLCARAIAQGVIREKGLAKLFCCELIPEDFTLQKFFLSAVKCDTLENFVAFLPTDKPSHYTWLIFDAVDELRPGAVPFLQKLIQLSRESDRFKVLLCTHAVGVACAVLGWANTDLRRIKLVEPVGCCRWKESQLSKFGLCGPTQVRAGCPVVMSEDEAGDLEVQWSYGISRLSQFVVHR